MDKILIVDFGSQYNQLISRRIREMHVFSEVVAPKDIVVDDSVKGIILSGGPSSVYDADAPALPKDLWETNVPILGICYGMQAMVSSFGGVVRSSSTREYGKATMEIVQDSPLTQGMSAKSTVWMSHGDHVEKLPQGFEILAETSSAMAMIANPKQRLYAVQFHPEVTHTEEGTKLLEHFVFDLCGAAASWYVEDWMEDEIQSIRDLVQQDYVILGLSGGVDSSVAAALIHKAIGSQLTCLFVDTGLLRDQEAETVMQSYQNFKGMKILQVDASKQFFEALQGVSDPEQKRKIIGKVFFDVFEAEKSKHQNAKFLAQGTIYPDVIESVSVKGPSATIKSHHNVGGIPGQHQFQILEPLRTLFKDEVRQLGMALGLPRELVMRHPFPGPGLGIRILGEVTKAKADILRHADRIFLDELRREGWYDLTSQAFVVLLGVKSVGVMGDQRTYEYACALRSVNTTDFMTASVSRLSWDLLEKVSSRIVNEVKGINRVTYDLTSKPPGTIEWE